MTIISWFLVNIHLSQFSVPSSKFLRSFLKRIPPSPISDGIIHRHRHHCRLDCHPSPGPQPLPQPCPVWQSPPLSTSKGRSRTPAERKSSPAYDRDDYNNQLETFIDDHPLCGELFPRQVQMILNLPHTCAQAGLLRLNVLKLTLKLRGDVSAIIAIIWP